MDVIAAYQQVGSFRGAAELCGTTHKTVKRIVTVALAGEKPPPRRARDRNYDDVATLVRDKVAATQGRARNVRAFHTVAEGQSAGGDAPVHGFEGRQ